MAVFVNGFILGQANTAAVAGYGVFEVINLFLIDGFVYFFECTLEQKHEQTHDEDGEKQSKYHD